MTGRFTAAVVGAFVAILTTLAIATPASAATILVITPSEVAAGFAVTLSATCGDNANPAFVSSRAFGDVTLVPSGGKLRTNAIVPAGTAPGTYPVNLTCASGEVSTSKLIVLDKTPPITPNPHIGPATGGGELAASTGARLAIIGGALAVLAGLFVWISTARRRRSTLRW